MLRWNIKGGKKHYIVHHHYKDKEWRGGRRWCNMVAATRRRKKKRGEGEGEEDRGLWEGEQQWRWLGKTVVIAPGGKSARLKRYWARWWERGWKGENLIIPLLTTVFIKQCWKVNVESWLLFTKISSHLFPQCDFL